MNKKEIERYTPHSKNILNKDLYDQFIKKYPKYKDTSYLDITNLLKAFNVVLYNEVIDTRDGVQLPQEIGWLFIGTCEQSKKKNVDFNKTKIYGVTVTNKNWESDGKLAKIFYSNYSQKHKIKNREFWAFTACRSFKRKVAKTYPENWTMYVQVEPTKRIKEQFEKSVKKDLNKILTKQKLKTYNEFDL
jgi:hypothetical protein